MRIAAEEQEAAAAAAAAEQAEHDAEAAGADQFDEQPTFGEISLHERQEAILHMLAQHDVEHKAQRGADSDWGSDTASITSSAAVPPAKRLRKFLSGIGEYSARKTQEHRTKQERTFEDLAKVEQMLLSANRMAEAEQVRKLTLELSEPPPAEPGGEGARGGGSATGKLPKKGVSADQFLRFLQKQAVDRSEDDLMAKLKTTMYEEDPEELSTLRFPPIGAAADDDASPLTATASTAAPRGAGAAEASQVRYE
eukprot:COSAG01_NODE_1583_length_9823_cov_3.127931_2_plen_253_part_00